MLYNFISRNRASIGKSECSKLFVPGSKFKKFRPDSDEDVTPRKKPAKYLGIPDEQTPENYDSKEQPEKTEHSDQGTDSDKQSGSDRQAKILNDIQNANNGDISDEKENTIFRTAKRT